MPLYIFFLHFILEIFYTLPFLFIYFYFYFLRIKFYGKLFSIRMKKRRKVENVPSSSVVWWVILPNFTKKVG